jgi:hypothetical protein
MKKFSGLLFLLLSVLTAQAMQPSSSSLQLAEALQKLEPAQRGLYSKILDSAGVPPKWLETHLGTQLCEAVLAPMNLYTPRAHRVALKLGALFNPDATSFMRKTLVEGKSVAEAIREIQMKNFNTTERNFFMFRHPEFLPEVLGKESLSPEALEAILEPLLKEIKEHDDKLPTPISLWVENFSKRSQTASLKATIFFGNDTKIEVAFEEPNTRGLKAEQWAATLILATIMHRELLWNPLALQQEMHMLSYTLKKVLRVGDAASIAKAKGLADELDAIAARVNPSTSAGLEQIFLAYLRVKDIVIEMGQNIMAAEAEVQGVEKAAAAAASASPDAAVDVAADVAAAEHAPVAGSAPKPYHAFRPIRGRSSPAWNNIGHRSRRTRYYLPYHRRYRSRYYRDESDSSSSMISTMAWFMNPHFMLTHPWFWGTRDNSILAPFLLFSVMQDRNNSSYQNNAFLQEPQYSPQYFQSPQQPVYYQGNDLPVADPWNAPARPDMIRSAAEGGWLQADGAPVVVDTLQTAQEWKNFVGDAGPAWGDAPGAATRAPETQSGSWNATRESITGQDVTSETLDADEAGSFEAPSADFDDSNDPADDGVQS